MPLQPDRYARHRLIEWWDQEALARAAVMVVGCGALGSEVVRLLALVGVGRVLAVDPDRIELHNLTRGVFFRAGDVGRYKAVVTARRAAALNPDMAIEPIVGRLETHVGLGLLREMSVLACCVDSIGARVAANSMCYRAGVPWVNGGISPTAGEVTAFGASSPPCYGCTVSDEMWEREQLVHTCRGFRAAGGGPPAATTATVASVIAAFQVQQILTRLSPHHSAPICLGDGQKVYISLSPPAFMVSTIVPSPTCGFHEVWTPDTVLSEGPDELTVQDLLGACGCPGGSLELEREILLHVRYPCCDRRRHMGRPLWSYTEEVLQCPTCGSESGEAVTLSSVRGGTKYSHRPLANLGVPKRDILAIRPSDKECVRYVEIGPRTM